MGDPTGTAGGGLPFMVMVVTTLVLASLVTPVAALTPGASPSLAPAASTQAGGGTFTITDNETNAPVREGEPFGMAVVVNNTGGNRTTQTINLTVGGVLRDSASVTLDPGDETRVILVWNTTEGDKGTYRAIVATDNDSVSRSVEVRGNPHFAVRWSGSNAPLREGETLNVSTTAVNDGDGTGKQVISLRVNGTVEDSREVSLEPGESQNLTLQWEAWGDAAGWYNVTVSSHDTVAYRIVTVRKPINFSMAITDTNAPVFAGQTLNVSALVVNEASQTYTKTITLGVNGTIRDSLPVTLAPGNSTRIFLRWSTGDDDGGNYTATVSSPNASTETNVTVLTPPGDAILVDGGTYYRGQVIYSGIFEANTDVRVTHDEETFVESVTVGQDGILVLDTRNLTSGTYILEGAYHTREFTLRTQTLVVTGNRTAVKNRGRNTSMALTVASNRSEYAITVWSPKFNAAGLEAVLTGVEGTPVDLDGDEIDEALLLTVSASESSTVVDFEGVKPGIYTLTVNVTDTTASDNVTIVVSHNDPPTASIRPVSVTAGQSVTIESDITTDSAIASYEWTVDGEVVSTEETLEYAFDEPGDHQVTLKVTDDAGSSATASRTIDVEPAATPTATPTDSLSPTPTSASGPGFGALLAVLAVVVTVAIGRRRDPFESP